MTIRKQKKILLFGAFFLLFSFYLSSESPLQAFTPSPSPSQEELQRTEPPVMEIPSLYLSGLPLAISLKYSDKDVQDQQKYEIRIYKKGQENPVLILNDIADSQKKEKEIQLKSGSYRITLQSEEGAEIMQESTVRIIPGTLSILPPIFAILLAIFFRQVIAALLAGVYLGALFIYGFNPFIAFARVIDRIFVMTVADQDHAAIILFTLFLGGMVGVISKSGGMKGIAEALGKFATTSRRGQLASWVTGMIIFFDDYASTLIVGNTLRPLTDKLKISREKLSYIIDSTAAPIASIALISTWIGFEVSLIADSFKSLGIDRDPYQFFLATIPYRFYPIFALFVVFAVALTRRDIGPMVKAERRSRSGQLMREGAIPLSSFDHPALTPSPEKPKRWFNALIPIGVVILVTFLGLWFHGLHELSFSGNALAEKGSMELIFTSSAFKNLGTIFSAANPFYILLWASFAGALTAIFLVLIQKILTLGESFSALVEGMKSMLMAIIILVLAWSIKVVCDDLHTSLYLIRYLSGAIPYFFLPALIFILSCFISFSTGTSWGTMGIMYPLIIPLSYEITKANHLSPEASYVLMLGSVASILAGAVFGDHCSPISDTTILSSMASSSDHIDHVRTQIPYALLVAAVGILIGNIPTAFGLSPFIPLVAGMVLLYLIIRFLGKKSYL
jgi:Na+/H+ antiporter NhaC